MVQIEGGALPAPLPGRLYIYAVRLYIYAKTQPVPPKNGVKTTNVKKSYLKCQFFSKKRAYFSKRRAYFFVNCHFRNCIFLAVAVQATVQVAVQLVVHPNYLIISSRCKWCKMVQAVLHSSHSE